MFKKAVYLLLAVCFLLALSSCDEGQPPYEISISMAMDGSQFKPSHNPVNLGYGKPFFSADGTVYYLGSQVKKQDINTGSITLLSPQNLSITDKRYLVKDEARERLYFAANHAIYSMDFEGNNLMRLSPQSELYYSAPAISNSGNYLTAIKAGHIVRMDLLSGEWIELPIPVAANYAVYMEDAEEYYFYSISGDYSDKRISLCRFEEAVQDSTLVLSENCLHYDETTYNFQISENYRYLGMHCMNDVHISYDGWGYQDWYRYSSPVNVYDRITGDSISIPYCYSYTFAPDGNSVLYSHYKYGMADLQKMDLSSNISSLIWDGYLSSNDYSYCISEIHARQDGQKVYLKAWGKQWKDTDNDKAISGRLLKPETQHPIEIAY